MESQRHEPPATDPAACAARIAPQAPAPPSCVSATTGPRTSIAGNRVSWNNPKLETISHTQRRETNSLHPCASSLNSRNRGGGVPRATRICARSSAETAKLAASATSAQPGFAATTITAPTAGPAILIVLRPRSTSAFASCNWLPETTCGTSPTDAGRVNAVTAPKPT